MLTLSKRERMLAGAAGAVLACLAIWSWVLAPALAARTDSFAQLRKIDILWAMLDQLPAQTGKATPSAPLRQRVTDTARSAEIDIRRIDPQGTAVLVVLDETPFVALIGWLETLTTQSGIQVLSADIGQHTRPGHVSARLTLGEGL